MDWVYCLFAVANTVSLKSKDPNTKVGAVLADPVTHRILCTGYNGFPAGIDESPARWERPTKYKFVCHAEANVITTAARFGIKIDGCDLYINLEPCSECAKLIVSAGIKRVFYQPSTNNTAHGDWKKNNEIMFAIFDEAGVELKEFSR